MNLPDLRRTAVVVGMAVLVSCLGCGTQQRPTGQGLGAPQTAVPFGIDLQEGFDGSQVIVSVDGVVVYEGKATTNPVLGFAEGIRTEAQANATTVRVQIPTRDVDHFEQIDLSRGNGVGISITSDGVRVIQSPGGFGYD
jgi:hypothetical protein